MACGHAALSGQAPAAAETTAGRGRLRVVQSDRGEPAEDARVLCAARLRGARRRRQQAAAVLREPAPALDARHQRRKRAPRERADSRRLHARANRVCRHQPAAPRDHASRTQARSRSWSYVRDVDALLATATQAGVRVLTPGGKPVALAGRTRAVLLEDPDGRPVELRQVRSATRRRPRPQTATSSAPGSR